MTESAKSKNDVPLEASIPDGAIPLESILCTEELHRRPWRPPDYGKENRALVALVSALADSPRTILQTLAEKVLEVLQADSAGLSLLTKDEKRFYWAAIAGAWQPHLGGGTPRDFGPCGDVLDRNVPMLFTHWERRYPYLRPATPLAEEGLLVPFYVNGKAVGTIWVIAHNDRRKFDAEDLRLLESLGRFASAAYQALASIEDLKFQIAEREKAETALRELTNGLETQVRVRTEELEQRMALQAAILLENARLYSDLRQENSERQRAEDELRRSETDLLEAQRLSHTGNWTHDVSSGTVTTSPEALRIFGVKPDEDPSTAEFFFNRIHPEDRPIEVRNYERARLAKADFESDYRIVLADGSIKHIHNIGHPILHESGELLKFVGTTMDVTEQHQARAALEIALAEIKKSEDQHRLVIDTIPGLVWSTLPDGQADFANHRLLEFTGLSLKEALGWSWGAAYHPDDHPILDEWRTSLAAGEPFEAEARMRRADGEYRWFLIRSVPLRDEQGNIVRWYGTHTDIEDRKQAEALLAGEKRLLEIIVKGNSLALILDALCRLVEELSSGSLSSILLLDPNGSRLWHGAAPSLPASYTEAIDGSVIGPSAGSCGTAAYRGEPVIVSDIATDPLWADYRDLALVHGLRACWSMPILSSHGRVLGTFAIYTHEPCSPTPQQHNIIEQISHLASIAIERQRAEDALHYTQAELAHVNRVATLGELTASIAHEINQPLAAVVNNASACLRWLTAQKLEEARQSAALVVADGHRAGEIIGRIRALAKKAPPQKDWIDIKEAIREVIALTRSEVHRNGIVLETQLSDEVHYVPLILADRIQLQQVMLNLIMNAIEAMSGSNDGPRELLVRSNTDESRRVLVAVRDSGPGLDPQSLERLFDAFYTTKPHGLGMGLAISRSIIEAHGGRLWATANEGRGATFQFTLPTGGERAS